VNSRTDHASKPSHLPPGVGLHPLKLRPLRQAGRRTAVSFKRLLGARD